MGRDLEGDAKPNTGSFVAHVVATARKMKVLQSTRTAHQSWWNQFWNRSWIFVRGPQGIARLDIATDKFTGIWEFPRMDHNEALEPVTDEEHTFYLPWSLKGK